MKRTATLTTLQWPKRPRRLEHPVLGRYVRWQTRCGGYRVDRYLDVGGPARFYALVATDDRWDMIGTFPRRTRQAAQTACERHDRKEKA